MQILLDGGLILLGYLMGSIPFGLIWVKLISGKDIRHVASGRTGGTNAARAAGPGAGILTAIMDGAKGACAAWIAMGLSPGHHWVHVLAPLAAILGHNYSIFLIERGQPKSHTVTRRRRRRSNGRRGHRSMVAIRADRDADRAAGLLRYWLRLGDHDQRRSDNIRHLRGRVSSAYAVGHAA